MQFVSECRRLFDHSGITAHNYYLTVLSEQGLVGLFFFCGLLLTIFRRFWSGYKYVSDLFLKNALSAMSIGVILYFMMISVGGGRLSFNGSIYINCISWILIGLVWKIPEIQYTKQKKKECQVKKCQKEIRTSPKAAA